MPTEYENPFGITRQCLIQACKNILGEDVYEYLHRGSVSLPRIHDMAALKAFYNMLDGEYADDVLVLRAAQTILQKHGFYKFD